MHLIGCLMTSLLAVSMNGDKAARGEYVVILHGLGRTPFSMKRMEWAMSRAGYRVINLRYPSRSASVSRLAKECLRPKLSQLLEERPTAVHFVTHSMGGLVLRAYLSNHNIENPGRIVMLAPPNQGSELADRLQKNWLGRKILGPALRDLGTAVAKTPAPAGFETGIIAGDKSLNPFFAPALPKPNDGKVSVQSARLEGMKDFLVVHKSHTWMMWDRGVIGQTLFFLKNGRFARPATFGNNEESESARRSSEGR